jgi:predicted pyridoxine 5'-phosphate oxidase superfamily flavin-nucleotide-binding protein
MPRQHQEFYERLPYVLVGHADNEGWPWASILHGAPGFIQSPYPKELVIRALPVAGDPLTKSLGEGTALGILGIELHTRRRNRLAAHITAADETGLKIHIDQAFGNCPKYIHPRESHYSTSRASLEPVIVPLCEFDEEVMSLLKSSDTFFVASYVAEKTGRPSDGVDVSHRGGKAGFVRVDDRHMLTVPDYQGNNHFNTLGNFQENPRAGLLFVDFDRGHLLMLTGRVKILWDSPEVSQFEGANRLWTFELDHGIWLKNALPLTWQFKD